MTPRAISASSRRAATKAGYRVERVTPRQWRITTPSGAYLGSASRAADAWNQAEAHRWLNELENVA